MENNLTHVPRSRYKKVGFRDINKSKDYNENQLNILNDLLFLYDQSNVMSKSLTESLDFIRCEKEYTDIKLYEMENTINNLKLLIVNSESTEKVQYVYPKDIRTSEKNSVLKDLSFNSISVAPAKSQSKIRLENDKESFLPNSLDVTEDIINFDSSRMNVIYSNDILNAFDGKRNTVWFKKIHASKSVSEIVFKITITLPENVVSTYDINEISLKPYPANTLSVYSIRTRMSNGAWKELGVLKDHSLYKNGKIDSAPNLKFNFKNISANQIEIIAGQPKYLTEDSKNMFYFGFSDIDIRSNKYTEKFNFFDFDINLPNTEINQEIVSINAMYNNKSDLDGECVQYEFLYEDINGFLHKINESLPFIAPKNTIKVKGKLYNQKCSPNISNFKVVFANSLESSN